MVRVVDEGIGTTLHDVAGVVVAIVCGFGLEQPVIREVDAVVIALAIVDQCRAVSVLVVLEESGT